MEVVAEADASIDCCCLVFILADEEVAASAALESAKYKEPSDLLSFLLEEAAAAAIKEEPEWLFDDFDGRDADEEESDLFRFVDEGVLDEERLLDPFPFFGGFGGLWEGEDDDMYLPTSFIFTLLLKETLLLLSGLMVGPRVDEGSSESSILREMI